MLRLVGVLALLRAARAQEVSYRRARAFGAEEASRALAEARQTSSRRLTALDGTDHRADLCERSRAVTNGTIRFTDALAGLTLHAAAALYDDDWIQCDADGACTGFHPRLGQAPS